MNSAQGDPLQMLTTLLQSLLKGNEKEGGASNHSTPASTSSPSPSAHDVAPAVMDDAASQAMKNTVVPTSDGGGQVNNTFPKATQAVTSMMDNNKDTFGTPSSPVASTKDSETKGSEASDSVSTAKTSAVTSNQKAGSTAGMEGFAKVAGTTGGAGGETVTVNSVGELKEALAGDDAKTIKLGSNISASEKTVLNFGANKTLIGDGDNNQLHNIYLSSGDSAGNDIFQNLHFSHDSKYNDNNDIPLYLDKGKGYWIDHSTFTGTKGSGNDHDSKDKLLYVGGTADMVSLTNSKFENNKYGLILGYPEDTQEAADKYSGYPRMTIAHNDFENLDVRAPGLMRHGQFDVYNNHISDFNLGFTAASNATILSEANYFENGRNGGGQASVSGILDDKGSAQFTDIGSNVSVQNQTSAKTSWRGGPYERNILSPEEAKQFAVENAGVQSGSLKFTNE